MSLVARSLLAAAGVLMFTPVAFAQDLQNLRRADSDGDGAISVAEAESAMKSEFSRLDKNGDGSISEAEFIDARLANLAQLDSNGDQKITRDEIRAHVKSLRP
ncbi:hypothetical protein [Dongia sp.]|uniref:hypothetical protein n=1 Tax=Dongia sp. TaxID=1977262 RepID=UPI0035AF9A2F